MSGKAWLWGSIGLLVAGCRGPDVSVIKHTVDADSDGYAAEVDCDDAHATVNPDAAELCDGLDNNCDGVVDEAEAEDAATWYADTDQDGYGDAATALNACENPGGYVSRAEDCDDADPTRNPGVAETDCTDPIDHNCDGSVGYADADQDGFAACAECDDGDAAIHPDAAEVCDAQGVDEDCDGLVNDADPGVSGGLTWYADGDGDGYGDASATLVACEAPSGAVADATDCRDSDAAIHPGAAEVCDALDVDEDCDNLIDDADPGVSGRSTWYTDGDSDGYGDVGSSVLACSAPAGTVADATDCLDADAAIHPGATEVCDALDADEDCDSLRDDADPGVSGGTLWYTDGDSDGFGDPSASTRACTAPAGTVADATDCRDSDAAIHPGATEVCDAANTDEDCDNLIDDADSATGQSTFYADADGDLYGDAGAPVLACDLPSGAVSDDTDCDDADPSASPIGVEVCEDGVDQDCSGADDTCPEQPYSGIYAVSDEPALHVYGAAGDRVGPVLGGDFDGDGYGDLLVGAEEATYDSSAPSTGAIYGFYAPLGGGSQPGTNGDLLVWNASSQHSSWGAQLYDLGDVNGDGVQDWSASLDSSVVRVFYGGDLGIGTTTSLGDASFSCSHGTAPAGLFTTSATTHQWACRDANASSYTGRVYLYSGISSTTLITFTGESSGDFAGWCVAGDGDVNGDGRDDLWIGALENDSAGSGAGAVYLELGGSPSGSLAAADAKLTGGAAGDKLGVGCWMPGDLDGDGYDDSLHGASYQDSGAVDAGSIYLVLGQSTGTRSIRTVASGQYIGEDAYDRLGQGGVDLGDIDGDGELDLVAASYSNDTGGTYTGTVYVVYGPLGGTLDLSAADVLITGDDVSDYLGINQGVTVVPDMDGDGDDEFAMSTYLDDDYGTQSGAAWLWLGRPN